MAEEERFAPFADAARARDADRLGMLIFLASEIMLFGGIFAAALALRLEHGPDYAAAAGHLKLGPARRAARHAPCSPPCCSAAPSWRSKASNMRANIARA